MLRNYLITAWRSLCRRPGFATLNVAGLAAGLTCVLLIGLWVADELSYDRFHADADRTYRVLNEFDIPELQALLAHTPSALAPVLQADYPQVEQVVRVQTTDQTVRHEAQKGIESNVLYADPGFFELFDFPVEQGSARLEAPGTMLITPSVAARYFPDSDPIGRTLHINEQEMEVTGIISEAPSNTHLNYSMVASLATQNPSPNNWQANDWVTYLKLTEGSSAVAFERSLQEIAQHHLSGFFGGDKPGQRFHLQPVTAIHLNTGVPDLESGTGAGTITFVYLFSALALFVLLLACINFMNLSTARSSERAREVGVRKAVGADRGQLAGQFIGESLLTTGLALLLALGASVMLLPAFNDLAGKSIELGTLASGPFVLICMSLILVVGIAAGAYPAFVLSRYNPVETMRKTSSSAQGSPRLRQALVVFQFAISIALIAGTAIVHQQISYLQSKGLGFEEGNLLVIHDETQSLRGQHGAFKQEVSARADVEMVTSAHALPGTFFWNSMFALDRPTAEPRNVNYSIVAYDYIEALAVEMVAGRTFSRAHPADSMAVLLNEAAVERFGFAAPEDAIGEAIQGQGGRSHQIIGVTSDFHYQSLHRAIHPLLLFYGSGSSTRYVAARVAPQSAASTIDALRSTWQTFSDLPFAYSFLADDLTAQYEAEQRMETLFFAFALLAMLIACLGLFGLAAYAAQQRTKEIGIRKVLGATASGIVGLLSKEFLTLVGIAFVIAIPVAYLAMQRWLQDFAYRIDLHISTFVLAGVLALLIAALTVGQQAWRAARMDPAVALRNE